MFCGDWIFMHTMLLLTAKKKRLNEQARQWIMEKARTAYVYVYGVLCTLVLPICTMHDKKGKEKREKEEEKLLLLKMRFILSSLIIHCLMATNSAQDVRCSISTESIQFKFVCNMHTAHWIQYTWTMRNCIQKLLWKINRKEMFCFVSFNLRFCLLFGYCCCYCLNRILCTV